MQEQYEECEPVHTQVTMIIQVVPGSGLSTTAGQLISVENIHRVEVPNVIVQDCGKGVLDPKPLVSPLHPQPLVGIYGPQSLL